MSLGTILAWTSGNNMADNRMTLPDIDVNPRLVAPLRVITQLAQSEHDWDGYGSAPIQQEAVATAIEILKATDVVGPPTPRIGPVTGGGLQFEWSVGGRELELEVLPDGSLEWVKTDDDGVMSDGELPRFGADSAHQLIDWLMNRSTSPERG